MARKRMAKAEEIATMAEASIVRFFDALMSPGADASIHAWIAQLQHDLAVGAYWLDLRKKPKKEVQAIRNAYLTKVREHAGKEKFIAEDLETLAQQLGAIADMLEGKGVTYSDREATFTMLKRLTREPPPPAARRFKAAFEKAFYRQSQPKRSGRSLTAVALAEELTPYEYERNPESAVRAMQRGIATVRAEHERCLREGIQSPFCKNEHGNS